MSTFNQNSGTAVPTLINSSAVLVTGNAVSSNALTVRQFGTGNVFSAQTTTGSTALFVGANGNVGVGTTSPTARLDVIGRIRTTQDMIVDSTAAGSNYSVARITTGSDGNNYIQSAAAQSGGSSANLIFTGWFGSPESMRITSTRRVGIGVTDPKVSLQVGSSASDYASSTTSARVNIIGPSCTPSLTTNQTLVSTLFVGTEDTQANNKGASIGLGALQGFSSTHAMQARISGVPNNSGGISGDLVFEVLYANTGGVRERMRINGASGNIGIGTASPAYQLDLSTDGARKLTTTTWLTGSDERIKTDIQSANLHTCYDIVKSIDLKYFKWNFPAESNVTVDDKHSLGFIAQDVKRVFPNAVSESNSYGFTDFLSLNTDQILKTMYGALKQTMLDKECLEARLAALEGTIGSRLGA